MTERRSWRFLDGALLVGLCALAVVSTLSIWMDIFHMAIRDEENSQVLLAPAVAAWLFWARRERARFMRPGRSILGPIIILAGLALAWLGFSRGVMAMQHLGALLTVVGAAVTALGSRSLISFLPAWCALLFLIPVPGRIRQDIAMPLQSVTAKIAQAGMELFGVPVARAGNVLTINGTEVGIAEACNGMRMVAALALVSYAFVFSFPMRNSVRVLILVLSPLVAALCNVIRLVPTALLYGYSEPGVASIFHDVSGWGVLVVALAILWLALALLKWLEVPIEPYAAARQ